VKKVEDSRIRAQILAAPLGYYRDRTGKADLLLRGTGVFMDQARNTDEFVRLFSLFTNNIYSYIHVLTPVHSDAEDIFQETSRTLWEKFGEFRPGPDATFLAWALGIARIEVLRHRQREGQRHSLFSDRLYAALDQATLAVVDSMDSRLESLGDCYQSLSQDDRQLVDTRYSVGATVEAIAAELGRSVHSVYRALRRIHRTLFDCIRHAKQQEEQRS
jgi:RNA polymerase sigma-70 factor, ECF subfamily